MKHKIINFLCKKIESKMKEKDDMFDEDGFLKNPRDASKLMALINEINYYQNFIVSLNDKS